ncbi:uncharacterized protein A4U43_C04F23480 [Asparagus officinalis]|uniref:Uncharacterized protein n=1 Tax=Asparagus officinalis TaxID=4686 RepID=A0A5P1F831_ASPOF|nr:uncharacterized protein A4U43_C04F23480 [Asparagus officinalis]
MEVAAGRKSSPSPSDTGRKHHRRIPSPSPSTAGRKLHHRQDLITGFLDLYIIIVSLKSSMCQRSYSTSDEHILAKPPRSTGVRWNYEKLMKKDCHLTVQYAIKMRKNDKKKAKYEMRQEVRISDEREEEAPELASIGSKKPRVSGSLDKMVADGKIKQSVLNKIERRQ